MPTSQNGYPANDRSLVSSRLIPGTTRKITVRKGPAGDLLLWVLGQFHARVEDIDDGQLDDWGYAERTIRGSTTTLSNHASGTAADVNAPKHPLGVKGTFSVPQVTEIHRILAEAQGCVRWGGDYVGRVDEMHFEIVRDEATCAHVLAALTSGPAARTEEDDTAMFTYPLPRGAGKHTDTITLESDGNSTLIQDVFVSLASGFDGLRNVAVFFPGGGEPAAGSDDRFVPELPKDTREWWKLPKGCFAFSIEYECVSDGSRPSLSVTYTRK